MRVSPDPSQPLVRTLTALMFVGCGAWSALASESAPPAAAASHAPAALGTLEVSSLGRAAPTDQHPVKAPALSVSPYT